MTHIPLASLQTGLTNIRESPADAGSVELIVRRPAEDEREVLLEALLDPEQGLVGDSWSAPGSHRDPRTMLTLMNVRAAQVVAGDAERRPLAGDQLFVDLNLGGENLPVGTRLAVGDAVIEVTDVPHTGCGKFARRFGIDAQKFVNSADGRELNLRGINARVIVGGPVRIGDAIRKLPRPG